MTRSNNIVQAINHFWNMSQESLLSAEREYKAGAYHSAVNRIYYAAFYAVTAALLEKNQKFVKHSGLKSSFHQTFIKTNLLDKKWGKAYDRFFDDRQEGDYIALVHFKKSYVNDQLSSCIEFINAVKPLIPSLKESNYKYTPPA